MLGYISQRRRKSDIHFVIGESQRVLCMRALFRQRHQRSQLLRRLQWSLIYGRLIRRCRRIRYTRLAGSAGQRNRGRLCPEDGVARARQQHQQHHRGDCMD